MVATSANNRHKDSATPQAVSDKYEQLNGGMGLPRHGHMLNNNGLKRNCMWHDGSIANPMIAPD